MFIKSHLKGQSRTENWVSHLSDGTCNQEASTENTDNRGDGKDCLNKTRKELVRRHSNSNRTQNDLRNGEEWREMRTCNNISGDLNAHETHLEGRNGNTGSVNWDDSSKNSFTDQRGHENSTNSRSRCHDDRKSDIPASNIGAEITSLTSIN